MPRLSASAPLMASGSPVNASAAARPATIPSGRLCNVTASTIRPPCPAPPASSCPANCSTCKRPTAPSTSPTADGIHAGSGKVCPRWIAGSSRLHTLAASMMPAAMPHRMRCVQGRDCRRSKNTPAAPSVVHAAGNSSTHAVKTIWFTIHSPFARCMTGREKMCRERGACHSVSQTTLTDSLRSVVGAFTLLDSTDISCS